MSAVRHLVRALLLLGFAAAAASAGDGGLQALIDAAANPSVSPEARAAVVAQLAQQGPAATPLLLARLRDPDPGARAAVAAALAHMPADALADDRVAPVLLDVFQRDPDATVRANAGLALGATGDHRALTPLLSALASDDRSTRLVAVLALRRLDDHDATPALVAAFPKEGDPEVQRAIVVALGGLGAFKELIALRATTSDATTTAAIDAQLAPVQELMRRESEVTRAAKEAEAPAPAAPTAAQMRYVYLQRHRLFLVRFAVLLLLVPSLIGAVTAFSSGVRAAALRAVMMLAAATLSVTFGGVLGASSAGLAHADPGSAVIVLVPFLEALMTVPVAMCAVAVQPRPGVRLPAAGVNALAWSALYAVLQFGTWALVPTVLDGNYFWYGQHPRWAATHAGHAVGVAAAVALSGGLAARLRSAVPLEVTRYAAVLAASGASMGIGYLIVNLYAY